MTRPMRRPTLVQTLLLLGLALVPAVATGVAHPRRPPWSGGADHLPLRVARSWGRDVLWLDARPPQQYLLDHIPGAVPIDPALWETLSPHIAEAAAGKRIIIYCQNDACADGQEIARRLARELKRDEIYILRGGFDAWNAAMR